MCLTHIFKEEAYIWATNTSAHGVGKVISSEWKWLKLLWILLTLTSLCVLVSQIVAVIRIYLQKPTKISVSVMPTLSLPLPSLTICNKLVPVRKSIVQEMNITGMEADYLSFNQFTKLTTVGLMNEQQFQNLYAVRDGLNAKNFNTSSDVFGYFEKTAVPCEDFIKSCIFMGTPVANCCARVIPRMTDAGYCYTLHSFGETVLTGAGTGLQIHLNLTPHEHFDYNTGAQTIPHEATARFQLHDHRDFPMPSMAGSNAPMNWITYAGVDLTRTSKLNINNWGECIGDLKLEHLDHYTLRNCFAECFRSVFLKVCGCTPLTFSFTKNSNVCEALVIINCLDSLFTYMRPDDHHGANFSSFNDLFKRFNSSNCDICRPDCLTNDYSVRLSGAPFFTDSASHNYMNYNGLALLDIFYQSENFLLNVEERATTLTETISDIGGQLGLFLGLSVLSLGELAECCIRIIYRFSNPGARKVADDDVEDPKGQNRTNIENSNNLKFNNSNQTIIARPTEVSIQL